MKSNSRVKLSGVVGNHPDGYLVLRVEDFDGGDFGLEALQDDNTLLLPSATAPGYQVALTASNPAALKRLANALNAMARKQEGANESDDETPDA